MGLPTGKAAAVAIPRHKMTSDESHLKLQGYFSGLVANAKAKDHYDQKTAVKLKAMAVEKLQAEATEAQAASQAAAQLLKPGGQSLVEYPQHAPVQQPSARPLPQGYIAAPNAMAPQHEYPVQYVAAATPSVAAPPPPPPAYSNAYNSFLAQVNQQAGAQLQRKWQLQQQAAFQAKQTAAADAAQDLRNTQLDLHKTAHAANIMAARRAKREEFAQAFRTTPTSQADVGVVLPKAELPKDVETGFLNTIIQRANDGASPGAAAATVAAGAASALPRATTPSAAAAVGAAGVGGVARGT